MTIGTITIYMRMTMIVMPTAIWDIDIDDTTTLAIWTNAVLYNISRMKSQAITAEYVTIFFISSCWEEIAEIWVAREIGPIKGLEIISTVKLIATLINYGRGPTGSTTITTIYCRKICA